MKFLLRHPLTLWRPIKPAWRLEDALREVYPDFVFSWNSAITMESGKKLALTLTLSPRRGNLQWPHREKSLTGEHCPALEKILPLPGGEGRGEGEREFQLISFCLAERQRLSRLR